MIRIFLIVLYFIASIFGIFVLFLVFDCNLFSISLTNKAPLLGAFGIILSAFIASLSVLKNIENTNEIEEKRVKQKIKSLVQSLVLIINRINVIELQTEDIKKLPIEKQMDIGLYLYKVDIPYLLSLRDSIVNGNYTTYIYEENNYILLFEVILQIDNISKIINLDILENKNIEDNHKFDDTIKVLLDEIKEKSKVLKDYYK